MRILIANSGHFYSTKSVGEAYFRAFKRLGHETVLYELSKWLEDFRVSCRITDSVKEIKYNQEETEKKSIEFATLGLLKTAITFEPDLIIFITAANIPQDIPICLHKIGFNNLVVILLDEPQETDLSLEKSWLFNYVFTNDKNTIEVHKENTNRHANYFSDPMFGNSPFVVEYLPTAVDFELVAGVACESLPSRYQSDVLISGSIYPERLQWLIKNKPTLSKFNTLIVGRTRAQYNDSWLKMVFQNNLLPYEEFFKYELGAKICIDLPRNEAVSYPHGPKNSRGIKASNLSPRIYEMGLAGCLIFTNDSRDDIKKLFPDGSYVIYNDDNLEEKLKYYLEHEDERKKMTELARDCVIENHTYLKRAEQILNITGDTEGYSWQQAMEHKGEVTNRTVVDRFGHLWRDNFVANKSAILECAKMNDLKKAHEDKIGIVVSAGPSLEYTLKKLIEVYDQYKNRIVLIATNEAYKILTKFDVIPNYFMIVHPEENQFKRQIDGAEIYSKTDLLLSSVVHPSVYKTWPKDKIRFFHTQANMQINKDLLQEISLPEIMGGISVATVAAGALVYMGVKKIIFVGQDFAYSWNRKYIKTPLKASEAASKVVMVANDLNGNAVLTDLSLSQSRDILIKMANHLKDVQFINASEAGILHGGNIIIKKLDEIFVENDILLNVA